MAWTELKPVAPGTYTGATLAIGGQGKNPRLLVKLGPIATPNAFRGGVKVSVATGSEAEFGLLRITTEGLAVFKLAKLPKSEALRLTLPRPAGVSADRRDPEPVKFRLSAKDEVIIELPVWARPKAAQAAPAPAGGGQRGSIMDGPAVRRPESSSGAADRVRAGLKNAGVTRVGR